MVNNEKYEKLEELGQGTFGVVYLAKINLLKN